MKLFQSALILGALIAVEAREIKLKHKPLDF